MNGIKGYISIREASYRWGVSERQDKHLTDPLRIGIGSIRKKEVSAMVCD